ncbi:hypothetical protein BV25DRAFT_1829628 [Artomyces pyxidatus]|uniref:Uncharacterized protein n=1 Tax=Artomyces pyxidatus TaxID=48021 RepID=A0ACB8SRM7_9AGAM|nr:hypothetical protein BV25DRAFT_1829628 [Artomyces pyxidatus]
MEQLSRILAAGALLVHSEKSTATRPDLKSLLLSRLSQYRAALQLPEGDYGDYTLKQAQQETALQALVVVGRVQHILDVEPPSPNGAEEGPAIGTRDISQLRTLLSIVFKWGTEPLLESIQSAWPTQASARVYKGPKFIDLTGTPEDYAVLTKMTKELFGLLLPRGVHGTLPRTLITSAILNRHVTDILRPGITLGWVPKSLANESTPVVDDLRPLVMRLLTILPPSQTISSLGSIISSPTPVPAHVNKSCSSLLSRQLLRTEGVRGLCAAVFGEGEDASSDAPLEKLTHIARVLSAAPTIVKVEDYYGNIVPRLLTFMTPGADVPPAYVRAAAFSLSRMISTDGSSPNHALVSSILLPLLHGPFLHITRTGDDDISADTTPVVALQTLQIFLTNTDPSPTIISSILSPIVAALYAMFSAFERLKTIDPSLKEGVRGLLVTWGRVIAAEEGIAVLWACIEGQGGDWVVDIAGSVKRVERSEQPASLALFTPEDLKRAEDGGDLDMDANILNLRPDPVQFVRFLKSLERADISSEVFVRLLEGYRELKAEKDGDPMRTLLFLQLVVQIQTQMSGEDASSSNILSKPEHILSFVQHALETGATSPTTPVPKQIEARPRGAPGLTMDDLRIIERDEDEIEIDGDSDDEKPGLEGVPPDDEMTVTALNLLLAILEANSDLSAQSTPVLSDISSHVDQLVKHSSDAIRPLAREARMVLTVRLASSSNPSNSKRKATSSSNVQDTYQKALKLLQDPILPVRAHGLLLLRELVTPPRAAAVPPPSELRPLVPAILDIFLQSIQDDDSYIFLNAVQGLSALVDGFGADVLRSLVRAYADGLDGLAGNSMTQQDVETRVRVGEALGQVVKRCGEALSLHTDLLVTPLFSIVRAGHLPTTIRTSALSLLAQCADASDLALLPYAADLSGAMLDLLQIESVRISASIPARPRDAQDKPETDIGSKDEEISTDSGRGVPSMDTDPLAANSKFPPLRRAALHFLALLVRAYTVRAYGGDNADGAGVLEFPVRRAKITLGYVASTDADAVVRNMAQEVVEAVGVLEKAIIGV